MKCYVITESKYQDLKTSKQKVAQHFMEQIANNKEKDLSLDEINEVQTSFCLTKQRINSVLFNSKKVT